MSNRLIAHLAHVELLTPKPEESLAFFKDVIGLEESGAEGIPSTCAAGGSGTTTRCS